MRNIKLLFVFFCIVVILGCATTPQPPESADDTLLAFQVDQDIESPSGVFGRFDVTIHERATDELVKKATLDHSQGYTIIQGLPPGRYYLRNIELYRSRTGGRETVHSFMANEYPFVLRPGTLTIPPYRFNVMQRDRVRGSNMRASIHRVANAAEISRFLNLMEEDHIETLQHWRLYRFGFDD